MSAKSAAIYRCLMQLYPPAPALPAWSFIPLADDVRLADPDAERVLADLQKKFKPEDLQAAKVTLNAGDRIGLHPWLRTEDRYVVPFYDQSGRICDLITSSGGLSGRIPLLAALDDKRCQEIRMNTNGCLYVVASMHDFVLLRSAGVAAAPVTHIDRLTAAGVAKLQRHAGGDIGAAISLLHGDPNPSAATNVALVGCDLQRGVSVISPTIHAAATHLARAEVVLSITCQGLGVWWPRKQDLDALRFFRRTRDVAGLGNFFRRPQSGSVYPLGAFRDGRTLPAREKPRAQQFEQLVDAATKAQQIGSAQCEREADQLRSAYGAEVDAQIFEPLLDAALSCRGVRARVLLQNFAHLARLYHLSLPDVYVAARRQRGIIPADALRQMSSLSSEMIKLVREESRLTAPTSRARGRWPRSAGGPPRE